MQEIGLKWIELHREEQKKGINDWEHISELMRQEEETVNL